MAEQEGPIPLTADAAVELWSRPYRREHAAELGLCVDCLGPKPGVECEWCAEWLPKLDAYGDDDDQLG